MLVERYGLDALGVITMQAVFLLGSDGTFTPEDHIGRINYELRPEPPQPYCFHWLTSTSLTVMPAYEEMTDFDGALLSASESIADYYKHMDAADTHVRWKLSGHSSPHHTQYIDETAPCPSQDEAKVKELAAVMSHWQRAFVSCGHTHDCLHDGTSKLSSVNLAYLKQLRWKINWSAPIRNWKL